MLWIIQICDYGMSKSGQADLALHIVDTCFNTVLKKDSNLANSFFLHEFLFKEGMLVMILDFSMLLK